MTIKQQLIEVLQSKSISQNQLARELGFSPALLSSYLKDAYKGDVAKVEQTAQKWLEAKIKKQDILITAPEFVNTPLSSKIFTTLDMAKILNTTVTIYGASGVGKTTACKEYQKTNPNVYLITASPARATVSAILYELALKIGVSEFSRYKNRLSRAIVQKLKNTQALVIVDESDHLPYIVLEELRIIQEEAMAGFALIGNDKVYRRLQGGVNQAHEFARLWSRVAKHCGIKSNTKGDVKAIARAWNLDIENNELMQALYQIGAEAGGLRALTQYLRLALMQAKGKNTTLTLELILEAKSKLRTNEL